MGTTLVFIVNFRSCYTSQQGCTCIWFNIHTCLQQHLWKHLFLHKGLCMITTSSNTTPPPIIRTVSHRPPVQSDTTSSCLWRVQPLSLQPTWDFCSGDMRQHRTVVARRQTSAKNVDWLSKTYVRLMPSRMRAWVLWALSSRLQQTTSKKCS